MTKVALVTGGTRGIGAVICNELKQSGYTVASVYHGNDRAADAFKKQTGIPTYKWDVGNFKACKEGLARVTKELGTIDILVNNAGITRNGVLHEMEATQWMEVLQTNLTSCFNMCRELIEPMRKKGFGRIINISSIHGQKGQFGQTNYSAAKAGMIGFTQSLAQENEGKGITVKRPLHKCIEKLRSDC